MAATTQIPHYASDGRSPGQRPLETAQRLVANGFAKPSFGRKGHLKAIWLRREDGMSLMQSSIRAETRYSSLETLEQGRGWKLRRLRMKDEDGVEFRIGPPLFTVWNKCLVGRARVCRGSPR